MKQESLLTGNMHIGEGQMTEKVVRPNQMRAADIKYGYIAGHFTLDVFTRELVGSYADYSINSKKAVRVLDEAIKDRGIDPLGFILRSDNGSQYISENFAEYCKLKGIYYDLLM
jgi:putative transposase